MEYTKQTTDRFLNLYRQLETIRDTNSALYGYYKKKYYEQFDEYRQIRNYLSHEEYGGGYPVAVSSLVCDDLEEILIRMPPWILRRNALPPAPVCLRCLMRIFSAGPDLPVYCGNVLPGWF